MSDGRTSPPEFTAVFTEDERGCYHCGTATVELRERDGGLHRVPVMCAVNRQPRLTVRYSDEARLRLESSPSGTRTIVELPHHC